MKMVNLFGKARRSTSAALVAAAVLVGVVSGCTVPPESFYMDPVPYPGAPGMIAKTFEASYGSLDDKYKRWVVMHQSTSVHGQPNLVVNAIMVPKAPWEGAGPRPIVAWVPGARGMADGCAPSKYAPFVLGDLKFDLESLFILRLLDAGYAVSITDYEGLGTPGLHSFGLSDPTAYAALDGVRAAINLPEAGLEANAPVALWGYSQGAQGSIRGVEVAPYYAPELNVVAGVGGGTPADSLAVAEYLAPGSLYFPVVMMTAAAMDDAFPELALDFYLNDNGRSYVEGITTYCELLDAATVYGQDIDSVTWANPLDSVDWQARLEQQRLGTVKPEAAVMLYHSPFDDLVPFEVAETLRDDYCNLGASVTWHPTWNDHVFGAITNIDPVYDFIDARLAGEPVTQSYC